MDVVLIKPSQLEQSMLRTKGILIDIRSQDEYHKDHLHQAVNVPAKQLPGYVRRQSRKQFLILYCDRGIMSLREGRKLAREGFSVGALAGGLNGYREWQRNHIDSSEGNLYDNNIWKK